MKIKLMAGVTSNFEIYHGDNIWEAIGIVHGFLRQSEKETEIRVSVNYHDAFSVFGNYQSAIVVYPNGESIPGAIGVFLNDLLRPPSPYIERVQSEYSTLGLKMITAMINQDVQEKDDYVSNNVNFYPTEKHDAKISFTTFAHVSGDVSDKDKKYVMDLVTSAATLTNIMREFIHLTNSEIVEDLRDDSHAGTTDES